MFMPQYGYGTWKFNKEEIEIRGQRILAALKMARKCGMPDFDAFAVHGMSGVFLAPWLIAKGFNVVMIRKPGENTHGSEIEGTPGRDMGRLVLIDDLVASGDTIRRVADILDKEFNKTPNGLRPKIIAVFLHDQPYSGTDRVRGLKGVPIFGYPLTSKARAHFDDEKLIWPEKPYETDLERSYIQKEKEEREFNKKTEEEEAEEEPNQNLEWPTWPEEPHELTVQTPPIPEEPRTPFEWLDITLGGGSPPPKKRRVRKVATSTAAI